MISPLKRRRFGVGTILALVLLLRNQAISDPCTEVSTFSGVATSPGLKDLAQARGIHVGAAVRSDLLADASLDPAYLNVLTSQYDTLTPETEMKWETLHPAMGVYDFSKADIVAGFAREHGMKMRGHCLVWNLFLPAWLKSPDYTSAQLKDILKEHITTVVSHFDKQYPGVVTEWDVFNEPPIGGEGSFWERVDTPEQIAGWAFQWAHDACPTCRLFCNTAMNDPRSKSNQTYQFIRQLRARNVPIDGIGLQCHINTDVSTEAMVKIIRQYAALKLEVSISEADYRLSLPACPGDLDRQAQAYGNMLRACLSNPACKTFVTWGFTDKYSWVPSFFPGYGESLPFSESYAPKPAYAALRAALKPPQ